MKFIALGLFAFVVTSHAAEYSGKKVSVLRPGGDRPCILFQLSDVTVADSIAKSDSPWFSIPYTAIGYKDSYALLLSSKLLDKAINVTTTGKMVDQCGHVGTAVVQMN